MGSIEHDNQFGRCGACGGQTTIEDGCTNPMCESFPSFESWKFDLTSEKESELACQFYQENIGKLCSDYSPDHKVKYELAEDAEDFILEDIVDGIRFVDEFYDYLKKQYKEEKGE